ncbi:MAG TPA: metallophosphoesterase [Gaiellaceae bacterium]|nr:metallophosphoesterase [Gaiellaceae bacterium]
MIRIAAAGDVHASEATRDRVAQAFEDVESAADVVLLAGDLTTTGEPEQAQVLADACGALTIPVFAVLGNHDFHAGRQDEVSAVLEGAGVHVLDRTWRTCAIAGLELGVVGAKGFVGGFPGSALPDFGEPLLRSAYAETSREAEAIGAGLREIVHCDLRVVLLHYAPIAATLQGEPEGIHVMLGCDRLATPIAEYGADLVLHGHAHAGSFEGCIGPVPVYNVAVHVTGKDFWIFELEGARGRSEVGVEGPVE